MARSKAPLPTPPTENVPLPIRTTDRPPGTEPIHSAQPPYSPTSQLTPSSQPSRDNRPGIRGGDSSHDGDKLDEEELDSELEGKGEDELDPFGAEASSPRGVTYDIFRTEPEEYPIGHKIKGFIEQRPAPFTIADLQRLHGGGAYTIIARRNGGPAFRTHQNVRISGMPRVDPFSIGAAAPFQTPGPVSTSIGPETVRAAVEEAFARHSPFDDDAGEPEPDPFASSVDNLRKMMETVTALKQLSGEQTEPPPATVQFARVVPATVWESLVRLIDAGARRLAGPAPVEAPQAPAVQQAPAAASSGEVSRRAQLMEAMKPALSSLAETVLSHLETGEPSLGDEARKWREQLPGIDSLISEEDAAALLRIALEKTLSLAKEKEKMLPDLLDRTVGALEFFAGKLLSKREAPIPASAA